MYQTFLRYLSIKARTKNSTSSDTPLLSLGISFQTCQKEFFRCQHSDRCNYSNELVALGILAIDGQYEIRNKILDTKNQAYFFIVNKCSFSIT